MPRTPRRRRLAPLLLVLLMLGIAGAVRAAAPQIDAETELLRLDGGGAALLDLPGAGPARAPWPVLLLLSDLDGGMTRTAAYAARLLANGVAVLVPVNEDAEEAAAPSPPPALRLGRALAAIARDARLDPARVVVLGLGEGARAALLGLDETPVAGLALLYPGCDAALAAAARTAPVPPRILLLHGDADAADPPAACDALAAAFPATAVAHRVLRGASYGWDAFDAVPPGGAAWLTHPAEPGRRTWSRPDPTATLIAADRVLGFVLAAVAR